MRKRSWLFVLLLGCGSVSSSVPDATPDPDLDASFEIDADVDAASTACALGASKLDQCTL